VASEDLELIKMQVKDGFDLHPSRREVVVDATPSPVTFFALFNHAFISDGSAQRDRGHVAKQRRFPHITFYSENAQYLDSRDVTLTVDGDPYTIYRVQTDETDETFQGEAWLVKA